MHIHQAVNIYTLVSKESRVDSGTSGSQKAESRRKRNAEDRDGACRISTLVRIPWRQRNFIMGHVEWAKSSLVGERSGYRNAGQN